MVRIRLKKLGRKHRPFYRIVAIDSQTRRDGRELEVLGTYDPAASDPEKQVTLNRDRVRFWIGNGAQPSETVASILKKKAALD